MSNLFEKVKYLKINGINWNACSMEDFVKDTYPYVFNCFGVEFIKPKEFELNDKVLQAIDDMLHVMFAEINTNTYLFMEKVNEEENEELDLSISSYKTVNYLNWANDRITEFLNKLYSAMNPGQEPLYSSRCNFNLVYGEPKAFNRFDQSRYEECIFEDYEVSEYYEGTDEDMEYATKEVSQKLEDKLLEMQTDEFIAELIKA